MKDIMPKSYYVRAAYEFPNPEQGEISLYVGDVVEVVGQVNDSWLVGRNCSQQSEVGNCPKNFVEPLELPCLQKEQKVFLATRSFHGEMAEDLSFKRGDVILGLSMVDASWWKGQAHDRVGIFPLTFVTELISYSEEDVAQTTTLPEFQTHPTVPLDIRKSDNKENTVCDAVSADKTTSVESSKHQILAKGRATADIDAQLDDELSFKNGDVIEIFHRIDEVFALGQVNSQVGQFPLTFVEIFDGCLDQVAEITGDESLVKPKFDWWKDPALEEALLKKALPGKADPTPSFEEQTAPIDLEEEYKLKTSHAFYSKPGEQLENVTEGSSVPNVELLGREPSKNLIFAQTLFKFVPENDNELGFDPGELVAVCGNVDEQWLEGELGGKRGIFPASYVEILQGHDVPQVDDSLKCCSGDDSIKVNGNLTSKIPAEVTEKSCCIDQKCDSIVPDTNCSFDQLKSAEMPKFDSHSNGTDILSESVPNEMTNHTQLCAATAYSSTGGEEDICSTVDVKIPGNEQPIAKLSTVLQADVILVEEKLVATNSAENLPNETLNLTPEPVTVASATDAPEMHKVEENFSEKLSSDPLTEMSDSLATEHNVDCPSSGQKNAIQSIAPSSELSKDEILSRSSEKEEKQTQDTVTCEIPVPANGIADSKGLEIAELSEETNEKKITAEPNVPDTAPVCHQEERKAKPEIKPKPKLHPKPGLSHVKCEKAASVPYSSVSAGSKSVAGTTGSKRPAFKKGVSFYLDNVIVYPNDSDKETSKCSMKSQSGESDKNPHLVEELGNRIRRRSVDLEQFSKTREPCGASANVVSDRTELDTGPSVTSPMSPTTDCQISGDATTVHFKKTNSQLPSSKPAVPPPLSIKKKVSSEKDSKKESDGLKVGQSLFYGSSDTTPPTSPQISKKIPPRPAKPKPNPKQDAVVPNGIFYRTLSDDGEQPKPVPCRPAPPRPTAASSAKSSIPPLKEEDDSFADAENMNVIQDIRRRISETEIDLEKLHKKEAELSRQLDDVNEDEKDSLQDEIEFCQANATGLKEELGQLKDELARMRPFRGDSPSRVKQTDFDAGYSAAERAKIAQMQEEENRKKRQEMRVKIIQEVTQTEHEYFQSLCLCLETFFNSDVTDVKCPPSVDLETLCGNVYEVVELSQKFINLLEANTLGKPFEEQTIGVCFGELMDDLKRVYAVYCRNHDSVINLLEKYEAIPEAQEYFNALVVKMRVHATVFDVGSILIKPVQRILKYPLLLLELQKVTETSHPDCCHLEAAVKAMREVAIYINEFKRRKDLVLKYKKPSETSLRDMLSRLTVRSYRKKLGRISMMVTGTLTVDENFSREELKFASLEEGVALVLLNISQYLDGVQKVLASMEIVANDTADYYGPNRTDHEIDQLCRVFNCLAHTLFSHFKTQVQLDVLPPLNSLVTMLLGPQKLIRKRYHKLLDYENAKIKQRNLRDTDQIKLTNEEVLICKSNYEALNLQLLEDLPKFYKLSVSVITDCLCQFVLLRDGFWAVAQKEMSKLLKLKGFSENWVGIVENFNIAHTEAVDRLSNLSFIPKSFNPLVDEKRRQRRTQDSVTAASKDSCYEQTDAQRESLSQLYPADKLFTVNEDFEGTQFMDLKLCRFTVVGVIKESDPMGNRERCLVTDGSNRGFVPKRLLVPYTGLQPDAARTTSPSRILKSPPASLSPSSSISSDYLSPMRERCSDFSEDQFLMPATPVEDELQSFSILKQREELEDDLTCNVKNLERVPSTELDPVSYRAEYDYDAESEIEASLLEGEIVKPLQLHDVLGNPEWWLVEKNNGVQGYVPAAYLSQVNLQSSA